MDSLLWEIIREEYRDNRAGALAARAVLADAIAEQEGGVTLAERLMRLPRGQKLSESPLRRKVEAFVHGPVVSTRRRVPKRILLALVGGSRRERRWIRIDRSVGGPHDGEPFVIEMGSGFSSYYGLVWAYGIDSAYEAAQDAFPFHFFREFDEDEDADEIEELQGEIRDHPTKPGVVMVEDESAASQTGVYPAERVTSGRRLDPYDRRALLRTGEIVEFVE